MLGVKIETDAWRASTVSSVVHELHPQQSNVSVVRAILCRDVYWTEYVRTALLISEISHYN